MIPSLFIYFFNFQCLEEIVVPNRNFVFLVATSGMTLCDPMDCSLPGSSVHGISQERILEWVVIFFFRKELNKCMPNESINE